MTSKKEKRLESKKRKMEAMLELTATDEPCEKKLKLSVEIDTEVNKSMEVIDQRVLTAEDLANLRARLKERQKAAMQMAKLYLTLEELQSPEMQRCETGDQKAAVIYPMDVQHLLLYAVQGTAASYKPRWCRLIRQVKLTHVVVIVVDAVSSADVATYPDSFQYLRDNFPMNVDVISPSQYGKSFAEELFRVPMTTRQLVLARRLSANKETYGEFVRNFQIAAPDSNGIAVKSDHLVTDRTVSCLDLMLSEEQMKFEGYPIPLMNSGRLAKYRFSKVTYTHPSNTSPLFAIDCEMVRTTKKNEELAWVAVVNEKLECVYQSLVKPRDTVVDYLTRFSGVSESSLQNVTTTLKDVQVKLQSLLPSNAILVGQSLNKDLHALELFHPYVIDTSVIYNLSGLPYKKTGLKRLTSAFLGRDIQCDGKLGHDPIEDAMATMELVLKKLKNGFQYGNVLNGWMLGSREEIPKSNGDGSNADGSSVVVMENSSKLQKPKEDKSVAVDNSEAPENFMLQWKFFFQQRGPTNSQSFFELAKRSEKSVAVAGFESNWTEGAKVLESEGSSDKKIARQTYLAASSDDHFVVFGQLKGVARELQQSDRCNRCLQRAFWDVTKQVKRVVKHLSANTLVTVVLSGKSEGNQTEDGTCFVKIV